MLIDPENLRDLLAALGIIGAAILLWALLTASPAQAQLAVSDAPVEAATADMDQVQEPGILQQDTLSATSLTTGGGGGLFSPFGSTLATWSANLNQGINDPVSLVSWMPGWYPLPPNAAQVAAAVTQLTLNTCAGAIAVANAQTKNFANEDAQLAQIEAHSSQATAMLQATQANTEAILALNQQVQMQRQLEATHITLEAVAVGEQLQERAAAGATTETSLLLGEAP